ncbi:MAG TPA: phosphoribosyltransferase family protein [Pirellulales bacterium]
MERYRDRYDAGRLLGSHLRGYAGLDGAAVFALPRGGVPVGFEVARCLHAPLDVLVVRKLGVPGHEELAMGAIAGANTLVLNREVIDRLAIPQPAIEAEVQHEQQELARREAAYRDGRKPLSAADRVAILVDDGLATGATMRAAVSALQQQGPARLVVAVPVAAADTCARFRRDGMEVVCPLVPDSFYAVGMWYDDFAQTTDEEIRDLLSTATLV